MCAYSKNWEIVFFAPGPSITESLLFNAVAVARCFTIKDALEGISQQECHSAQHAGPILGNKSY